MNRVVGDDEVTTATEELLRRATRGSALSKATGKRAFYQQMDLELPAAYAYATEVMAASSMTADAKENMAAFIEKRPPVFEDR